MTTPRAQKSGTLVELQNRQTELLKRLLERSTGLGVAPDAGQPEGEFRERSGAVARLRRMLDVR